MRTIEIYVDGSHRKDGYAGVAVVMPDIPLRPTEREEVILRNLKVNRLDDCLVWYWSPMRRVSNILPLERAAIRIAFVLAEMMLRDGVCEFVNICSDRRDLIERVLFGHKCYGEEISYMREAIKRANGAIRLGKVQGHSANRWNNLADRFARYAIDERNHQ